MGPANLPRSDWLPYSGIVRGGQQGHAAGSRPRATANEHSGRRSGGRLRIALKRLSPARLAAGADGFVRARKAHVTPVRRSLHP